MARRTFLILTGEPSGDAAGGKLARALRRADPDVRIVAVGGRELRAAGADVRFDISELSAMGFVEVVRQIPRLRRLERQIHEIIERERPDAIIPIDYPGFHLRVAKWARENGHKVVYYIGPQIWAWGAGRLPKIAAAVDRMLVVFPFEVEAYASAGVRVDFVGHPLLENLADAPPRGKLRADLPETDDDTPVLGLLPGSRVQEVRRILPVMVETAKRVRTDRPNLRVVVSMAPDVPESNYDVAARAKFTLRRGPAADIMTGSDLLLVTSGTATLEAALHGTPLAVLYRTSPLTFWIGRRVVKIPRISLVNIVAGEDLAPEFLQGDATADRITPWVLRTLDDAVGRAATSAKLSALRDKLGGAHASDVAARLVVEEAAR